MDFDNFGVSRPVALSLSSITLRPRLSSQTRALFISL
jgi:hypothetical protein